MGKRIPNTRQRGLQLKALERNSTLAVTVVSRNFVALKRLVIRNAETLRAVPNDSGTTLTRYNPYLISFIITVGLPSVISVMYILFIASNQYSAEARLAVQSAQLSISAAKTSTLGASAIPVVAGQDAYIIANYIDSRGIIDDLTKNIDIRAIYRRPEADFWARLRRDPSSEEVESYWKSKVRCYVDAPSGIITLTVQAFRPEDAQKLAQEIIAASEKLANDVSARARFAIMRQAEDEVRRAEASVQHALADMRAFRDKQGLIDPTTAANSTLALLQQTMAQKVDLETRYFVAIRAMSVSAPTVVDLKNRLEGVDSQIAKLKSELTGPSAGGARTIAGTLGEFEQLELKRVFAEKLNTMAQDALERSRLRAEQQTIFISTFVPPAAPEEAKYPERGVLSFLIPLALTVLWGIFALIAAAVEDHRY